MLMWIALPFAAGAQDGATATAAKCEAAPPGIVIYQPWNQDAEVPAQLWAKRLRELREGGAHTLLLQWTVHGTTDFLQPASGTHSTWLANLIDRAIASGWRVVFGLAEDPAYFELIGKDDETVRQMLQKRRLFSLATARVISKRWGGSPAFAGWYLPEEIDDLNWTTKRRWELLSDHLVALGEDLRDLAPPLPIYASAFFGNPKSAPDFAEFLLNLGDLYGGLWLVQDGLGTRRMNQAQTGAYLSELAARDAEDGLLLGLVEAFSETDLAPGKTAFCRSGAATIAARRALWCHSTGRPAQAVFSLTHLVADAEGSAGASLCAPR